MVIRLYTQASDPDAEYFLDKTPRYNLVADDILRMFPEGRFVVLWRNPLAVLASISESWLGGRWKPYHHKVDLYQGLEKLTETYAANSSRFMAIRYEDLVKDPTDHVTRVLHHLGLEWEPGVVAGSGRLDLMGEVGDRAGVRAYDQVSVQSLDKWRHTLASPVRRLWARRYLRWLGRERLALMGYDLHDLLVELNRLPADYSRLADDSLLTARGVLWSLAEPRICRDKLARLPHWRKVHSHD